MTTIILKTHHTRHQTPSTHFPGEIVFLHTGSTKSFSWKSREYTDRFALTFYCTYFLLSSELQNELIHMSELEVNLYVPQMVHVATDQGGTLREAHGKDNSDTA